jgi:hypothetical protein
VFIHCINAYKKASGCPDSSQFFCKGLGKHLSLDFVELMMPQSKGLIEIIRTLVQQKPGASKFII